LGSGRSQVKVIWLVAPPSSTKWLFIRPWAGTLMTSWHCSLKYSQSWISQICSTWNIPHDILYTCKLWWLWGPKHKVALLVVHPLWPTLHRLVVHSWKTQYMYVVISYKLHSQSLFTSPPTIKNSGLSSLLANQPQLHVCPNPPCPQNMLTCGSSRGRALVARIADCKAWVTKEAILDNYP